jgi:hypothetical protein
MEADAKSLVSLVNNRERRKVFHSNKKKEQNPG